MADAEISLTGFIELAILEHLSRLWRRQSNQGWILQDFSISNKLV
jgi:hypothetical protein